MTSQGYILPKFYRTLSLLFFVLSIFVLMFIVYLIWAKVIIVIIPSTEKVSQEIIFNIEEGAEGKTDTVAGRILLLEPEGSDIFQATGKKAVTSDVVGEVTITNNHGQDQDLVATTRLAAPENPEIVLVRLKKDIVVPSGRSIKVQVYPEDIDNFIELKPMKFIIPGLWGPLQEKIYAENSEVLSKGGHMISVATQDDLKNAEEKLKDSLYQQALGQINEQLEQKETLWPRLFSSQVEELNYDVEVDQEVSEFNVSMKLKTTIIIFNEDELITLARDRIKAGLEGDKLIGLDPKSFSYEVQDYNLESKWAIVKVIFDGNVLVDNIDLADKDKLLGLTVEEVKSYFSQFPEVESVEVKFQPAWLKKTPRFKEKIEIQVGE